MNELTITCEKSGFGAHPIGEIPDITGFSI